MIDLNERIADYLVRKGEISKEEVNVYKYGSGVMIDTAIETLLLLITGLMMKHLFLTMIFILVFTTTRMYTGGYHAKSRVACAFVTVLSLVVNMITGELIIIKGISLCFGVVSSLCCVVVVFFLAPIRNQNKILTDHEVKVYHRKALFFVFFFVIIAGICYVWNRAVSVCICVALLEVSLMMLVCRRCLSERDCKSS